MFQTFEVKYTFNLEKKSSSPTFCVSNLKSATAVIREDESYRDCLKLAG